MDVIFNLFQIKNYLYGQEIIAFDFETAPDEPYRSEPNASLDPHKAHIVGISFCTEKNAVYVPLSHICGKNFSEQDELWDYLKINIFENKNIIKIAHNLSFEAKFLYSKGILLSPPCYDTLAAAQMTLKSPYEFRTLADSGLKLLAKTLLNVDIKSFNEVTNKNHFDELDPLDIEALNYACNDAKFAYQLYTLFNNWFAAYLPAHKKIVENIESPVAIYCGIMEYHGIPIDKSEMLRKKVVAENRISKIKKQIKEFIGNIDIGENASTAAFKNYLYETLCLPVLKETENGMPAIDNQALQLLEEWCVENKPEIVNLFKLVSELKKWTKLKSTYIDGFIKAINGATGCIHPHFLPLGARTGRFASTQPNMQNCPRKTNDPIGIRDFIVAPEGHIILSIDFSQIELRVGAFYCRDAKMLATYRNGGDIHAQTTSVVFGIPIKQATNKDDPNYKERRSIAKNCNFGVFYGLYPKGLMNNLKFNAGLSKSYEECQEIINNLKNGYPALAQWQKDTINHAKQNGFVETFLGRRRYLPDINSKEFSKRSSAERCALNTPIQGTAADILKLACGRILEGLKDRPWIKPILQIHDELVFIVPKDKLEETTIFIKSCMEEIPFSSFDVAITAEASAGKKFGNLI